MSTAVRPRTRTAPDGEQAAGRRARRLRHQRRPRQGDDLPLALPPRAARPAELPDRGRGGRRLDHRRPPRPRPQGDRGRAGRRSTTRCSIASPTRLSYLSGDFGDPATFERLAKEIGGARSPVFYLEIPPSLFGMVIKGLADAGLTQGRPRGGREALRPRPRLCPGARRGGPRVHRRVPALPDRPLPGEDGPGGDPLPALREHGLRAPVEPQLPVVGADHDGGGLRRGGPGPFLRPRGSRARRGGEPPDAGGGRGRHGAPLLGGRDGPEGCPGGRLPGHARGRPEAVRARAVRGLPGDRRRGRRLDHGDLRGHTARDRQLALVGGPVLHPHG